MNLLYNILLIVQSSLKVRNGRILVCSCSSTVNQELLSAAVFIVFIAVVKRKQSSVKREFEAFKYKRKTSFFSSFIQCFQVTHLKCSTVADIALSKNNLQTDLLDPF